MLGVVDSDLRFRYIKIGTLGRCNDSSVYRKSNLSEIIRNQLYEGHYVLSHNVKIQAYLIAESAFALDRTLIKLFSQRLDITLEENSFNYRFSRCRSCVEHAFDLMKNRFRIVHKGMEFNLDDAINIIKTAAILHNICILSGDFNDSEWQSSYSVFRKPSCNTSTGAGVRVREALTHFFTEYFMIFWSLLLPTSITLLLFFLCYTKQCP